MKKEKNKAEIIFIVITILALISIGIFYFFRKSLLEKNGVYVLGRVTEIKEVENGYILFVVFRVNRNRYEYSHKTLPKPRDSIFFIQASSSNPKICRLLISPKVPPCLQSRNFFDSSWKEIPYCP